MSKASTQTCTACGKSFASEMTYCPHCRSDVPGTSQRSSLGGTLFVVILIAAGIVGVALKLAGIL